MRTANHEKGWLLADDGSLFGFSLGFDFCAEHEDGARYIKASLGISEKDFPIGVEDRTMTRVPEHLEFVKYDWRSRDKRYKRTVPAALLHCCRAAQYARAYHKDFPDGGAEQAKYLRVEFFADCLADKKWYRPERDDIVVSWASHDGFAIHVRGEENVRRLEQLHQAMLGCKVALADAAIVGFMRKPLSLVLVDSVSLELRQAVREQDEAHLRLYQALEATGIEARLKEAGRNWYGFRPMWRSGEGSDLLVFLNPAEQGKYEFGWFTIDELQQWAEDRGPVLKDERLHRALKDADPEWKYFLTSGLSEAGIQLRVDAAPVWMDEAKTEPGLRLLIAEGKDKLPDGHHSLRALMPYIEAGRRKYEETRAAKLAEAA